MPNEREFGTPPGGFGSAEDPPELSYVLPPCARPGVKANGDWWEEPHKTCTGTWRRLCEPWAKCSCACHRVTMPSPSSWDGQSMSAQMVMITGPATPGEPVIQSPGVVGSWQLRFVNDISFTNLGTFTGVVPRIGEKVSFLRATGIHSEVVRDVVHSVGTFGVVVTVYIDKPTGPGPDLHGSNE